MNKAASGGHTRIVKFLLEEGAEVDNGEGDGDSYTALTLAVTQGHAEIVKMLLKAGADINIRCYEGTPLEIARKNKFNKIIQLLEEAAEPDK